ncbi:pfs domain-containing protein [Beauveria brongniartii RCEF 3172]|uniref:Pfs domain-containing protein n=1 Tax=Beauveria brongniartii RCEF 3172 TaxID=1081107 RepID=A0A166VPM7_9HYPO|nr:pfs domain-containing protein [Beauveria brongniartii RCEF 3172]
MDWAQRWLLTFLASVIATVYWLLAARAAAKSRRQSQVAQDHRPDHSVPERTTDQTRKRLTIVYPEQTRVAADDAEVDIVAVHGLGSDADWSWICKDGEKHINWLRDPDMLPAQVPRARIIVYRYESTWHVDAPQTRLQLCGEELVHSLHAFRAGRPSRPLVLVGHSLGGNVIVQAFLYANDDSKYEPLVKTTVGLVFLGTPFRGSKWQPLADALAQLMRPAGSHRGMMRELGFDEPALRDSVQRFCKLCNKLSTVVACFSELRKTDFGRRLGIVGVAKGMIVEETSACIPGFDRYALEKDHLRINKYYGPTDPAFERVSNAIAEMCHRANDVVRRRFERRELITDNHVALEYNPAAGGCLHNLFVTDPLEDKKALKRKKGNRAAGTCEWILGTEHLTAWLGSRNNQDFESHANQVLWLHGNPGTGKSTLAIFLTDVLSIWFSATDEKTLAYFFCDSAFDTRRTATSVVRGLLLQLIQQHPPLLRHVLQKYNERKAKLFESFDALWAIFIKAAADKNTGRKYFIIDALDECEVDSQKTLLHQLRDTFHSPDAPSNVQILVTSRPYPEIRKYLGSFTCMDFACFPDAKRDIDQCIKKRVAQLPKYTEKIKERVTDILRYKAAGTFLWVGIACNELEDIPSKDAISFLEAMPSGLHALYERLFSAALEKEREKDTIRLILGFVAVSQRPLTLLELSGACRLRQDEDDVETRIQFMREYVESCRLMVVIQDEKVLLLHQSVKDYLIKAGDQACFSELQVHADLAYRCLDYLIEQFHNKKQNAGHFWDYATREWPDHAHLAQSKFVVMASQAEFFKIISPCRESWLAAYHGFGKSRYDKPPPQLSVLHVAARWGIPAIVQHVFHSYDQHNTAKGFAHLTDASHATELGCGKGESGREVMALLFEQPGDEIRNEKGLETVVEPLPAIDGVESNSKDGNGRVPLSWATERGQEAIAKAALTVNDVNETITLQLASSITCSSGTAELAALLPEKDANDTWANNEGRTPLHWASENGHVEVVKLFLAYKTHPLSVISGASKITADVDHMTALHYTVSNTSEEMAQYLLDAGVSINTGVARRDWSRSKLEIKARCIPDAGSDSVVHCSIHCGLTALHYAALTGCKKMTEYLLAQGANPNARSVYDETPLHLALKRDLYGPSWHDAPDRWNDPVYRIEGALDNIGYNANDEHEYGVTRDLIEQHRLAVLTLLLNKGSTDVNAKDKYGASSLHCVNYENDNAPDIIKLLIERGADISARNNQGQTALHLACSTESLCSVTALEKQGADIAAVDFESINAVHYAAQSGNTRLVQIMAQEWPATLVAARDKRGRNALHHLVKESYHADEEAIVSLVSAGVRVEDLDDEGSSPLSLYLTADLPLPPNAARVVYLFFRCGSNPSFKNDHELSLAHLYAQSWESRIEVLQTLEEFGVDVAAKDCEGRTLLHHCAIAGSLTEQAFHFLRDKAGLDKHLQDHHGKTPLQYATEERRKERDPFIYDPNRWSRTERILLGVPECP